MTGVCRISQLNTTGILYHGGWLPGEDPPGEDNEVGAVSLSLGDDEHGDNNTRVGEDSTGGDSRALTIILKV